MAKNLVIVESPAKAKTITRFLGKDYKVLASMGHVRDLPKSKMGIDVENGFEADYFISDDKKKVIKQLKDELKTASCLWLATDEDREGEAIGWHLLAALDVAKKKIPVKRIVFHEITEGAIKNSLKEPRDLDMNLVEAQQARRILDRLVGYELSPLLWKKVKTGLSAGRVQSVAVRLVVEREREIKAFVPDEYWRLIVDLEKKKQSFQAELRQFAGKKFEIKNGDQAAKAVKDLEGADYRVIEVAEKQVRRNPAAPFITSTLQQEASRKLGFTVKKTMMVAQQLYEGIDTGDGESGLITYMRTDSVNLSEVALKQAREVIAKEFGKEFVLDSPRLYKGKKGAQEAHEAIRPVDLSLHPSKVAAHLERDQLRLYELIWKRTLACQMKEAVLNRVAVDIEAEKANKGTGYVFRATGQTIVFPGFMEVYMEGKDVEEEEAEDGEKYLPALEKGEVVDFTKLNSTQHFTKPPARYTEASLVKKLEEEGIGRPSTYAPVISTVQQRGYVRKEAKQLVPEDIAFIVTDLLVDHFPNVVDVGFTVQMENSLDGIAEGEEERVKFLKAFYDPFHAQVTEKTELLKREEIRKDRQIGEDPETKLPILAKFGRFGSYVQLGEEKQKAASLPKGLSIEDVTLEQALVLLSFPKVLGKYETKEVTLLTGPYGPYLKWNNRNISMPEGFDIFNFTLDQAKVVLAAGAKAGGNDEAKVLGKNADGKDVTLKNGRFGPYVTDGKVNASLPKALDPEDMDLEKALELIKKKLENPGRGRFFKKKAK